MPVILIIVFAFVLVLIILSVLVYFRNLKHLKLLKKEGKVDYIDDEYLDFIKDVQDDSFHEFSDISAVYTPKRGGSIHYKTALASSSNGLFVNFNNTLSPKTYDGLFFFGTSPQKRFIPRSTCYLWRIENTGNELIIEASFSKHYKAHRVILCIQQPSPQIEFIFDQLPQMPLHS